MNNNVYIHVTAEIHIIDRFRNVVAETDWNEDKHLVYYEFDDSYNSLDDIEYYEILDFTINEIKSLLHDDEDLNNSYPNCYFDLDNVHIYSVYNNDNQRYF